MKKFGRTLIVGAVLVMGMSLMTGCGDDKKEKGNLSDSSTTNAGNATPSDADTSNMSIDEYIEHYGKDVTLGEYKGIKYSYEPVQVTDEEVQAEVQNFVSSLTTYNEDKESEAKTGDTVNIDFVGSVDGVEFEGGNTQGAGYDLVLGSGSFIDDFEDQIVGHKPGDTFDVTVTFPENYGKDELNGKDAVFVTTLNYIKVPVEAEYSDELVKENTDYSNMADYEKSVRDKLQASNDANAWSSAQNTVMVNAINNAVIDNVSETEVAAEA
ncbi:MAG: trigger factor, partial [Coprococcus sp.]